MKIEDWIRDDSRRRRYDVSETDALRDDDALQEAQLLDVRLDALRSSAWMLFDCRGALQIKMGNTAVVVARGVRRLEWTVADVRRGVYIAWNVVGSVPRVTDGKWSFQISIYPDADLELVAEAAEFHVGNVPAGEELPPDYTSDDDSTIRARVPSWSPEFEPVYAVFLDPR